MLLECVSDSITAEYNFFFRFENKFRWNLRGRKNVFDIEF